MTRKHCELAEFTNPVTAHFKQILGKHQALSHNLCNYRFNCTQQRCRIHKLQFYEDICINDSCP